MDNFDNVYLWSYGSNDREVRKELWSRLRYLSTIYQQSPWLVMGERPFSHGQLYTWSNKRDGADRMFSKLDRFLVSEAWKDKGGHYQLDYLCYLTSDHAPGILWLRVVDAGRKSGPKPFVSVKVG